MAHYAKLDNNNNVIAVHTLNNNVIIVDGVELEQAGIDFLTELYGHTLWKQTSYNGTIRKNFAGIGYTYDEGKDAFIAPEPEGNLGFDEATCQWIMPIVSTDAD